jgi:type I restriction enzyme S subunit
MTAVSIETPNGWLSVRLDAVGTVVTGSTPPTRDRSYYGHERMFASPADLGRSKYVTRTSKWVSRRGFDRSRRIPGGSTLFVCIGSTIGKVGLAADEMTANQQINAIIPSHQVDHEYLYYAAATLSSRVREQAGEQAVPLVNKSDFSAFEILLPPPDEQRAIACALAEVDQLITVLERLIAKKQSIKQGMMQELLTGKTRLPSFTEPWRQTRLRESGTTYGGLTGKTKDDFGRGSATFVTFMEVMQGARLRGQCLERVRVRPFEHQNSVQRGDLLFNGSSETPEEVALSAVVDFDASPTTYLNSFCFGYRPKRRDLIDSAYLAYFFRSSSGRALVASLAQGATRYNIAKTKLLESTFVLPALSGQHAIVEVLTDAEKEIDALNQRLAKAKSVKRGMMQELLTGRTRLPVREVAIS